VRGAESEGYTFADGRSAGRIGASLTGGDEGSPRTASLAFSRARNRPQSPESGGIVPVAVASSGGKGSGGREAGLFIKSEREVGKEAGPADLWHVGAFSVAFGEFFRRRGAVLVLGPGRRGPRVGRYEWGPRAAGSGTARPPVVRWTRPTWPRRRSRPPLLNG
jgi:hypothetical protein